MHVLCAVYPCVVQEAAKPSTSGRSRDRDTPTPTPTPPPMPAPEPHKADEVTPPPPPQLPPASAAAEEPGSASPPPPLPTEPPPGGATAAEVPAVPLSAGGRSGPKTAPGFKFKIVVESTAADIRKGQVKGAAADSAGTSAPLVGSDAGAGPQTAATGGLAAGASKEPSTSSKRSKDDREGSPDGGRSLKKPRSASGQEAGTSDRERERERDREREWDRERERDRDRDRERGRGGDLGPSGFDREWERERDRDGPRDGGFHADRGSDGGPPYHAWERERDRERGGDGRRDGPPLRGFDVRDGPPRGDAMHMALPPPPPSPPSAGHDEPSAARSGGGGSAMMNGIGSAHHPEESRGPSSRSAGTGPGDQAGDAAPPSAADVSALLRRGRLCLVLDLDRVLTGCMRYGDVSPDMEHLLQRRMAEASGHDELLRLDRLGLWMKLRPGVREFLRHAHDKFELWVRSARGRAYADALAELLDPRGLYFGGRIIVVEPGADGGAQYDGPGAAAAAAAHAKRLLAALEVRVPVAVVLDDRGATWLRDARNLFGVEPYVFFPNASSKTGTIGRSLLEINRQGY